MYTRFSWKAINVPRAYLKFEREDSITKTENSVKDTLRRLHDDFVLVPADKAANNVVVCAKSTKSRCNQRIGYQHHQHQFQLHIYSATDSFDEILKSHCKFIESVRLEMFEEDKNLPYLYWTPKLHKVPFKHWFIAGSSKCTATKSVNHC